MKFAFALTVAALALAVLILTELCLGAVPVAPGAALKALVAPDPEDVRAALVVSQRLPRVVLALHIGAVMAVSGLVLQALARNPLASPGTLGISAGAVLGVVAGAMLLGLSGLAQGHAALAGGVMGFALALAVTRLAGFGADARGLALILSGALVSMGLGGIAQALLLADPMRRTEFLSWIGGNINHVYLERWAALWPLGVGAVALLWALSRPLTVLQLGPEKAASAGVPVRLVRTLALAAAVLGAASAVAICGPIGFLGLIVPHLVRPFAGAQIGRSLPLAALAGAAVCLSADLVARFALAPRVLQTGVVLDLLGGIGFVILVRRLYVRDLHPAGHGAGA